MFCVRTVDGKEYLEAQDFCWDMIPPDVEISQIMLAAPRGDRVSLAGCEAYYFMNEGIAVLEDGVVKQMDGVTAKTVGGLRGGIITEVRVEHTGEIKTRSFPERDFRYAEHVWRPGIAPKE